MSVFQRFIRILGAELKDIADRRNPRRSFFDFEREEKYQRSSSQGKRQESYRYSQPRQPEQDPVIAGYYANLDIPYGSDLETVRKAWKEQLAKYHPDRHSADPERQRVGTEITKGLNHAYRELEKYLKHKNP
ncbi:MAG: J domain-containing protein [Chlorobiales bacterium]|nr:J domain-containing protein [Chlorobiales bacterium]